MRYSDVSDVIEQWQGIVLDPSVSDDRGILHLYSRWCCPTWISVSFGIRSLNDACRDLVSLRDFESSGTKPKGSANVFQKADPHFYLLACLHHQSRSHKLRRVIVLTSSRNDHFDSHV